VDRDKVQDLHDEDHDGAVEEAAHDDGAEVVEVHDDGAAEAAHDDGAEVEEVHDDGDEPPVEVEGTAQPSSHPR
jgi:hypothetical protein